MKLDRLLFCFLFLILAISFVDACQYQENESYPVQKEVFYHNGDFMGYDLNLSQLVYIKEITSGINPSFRIYNDLRESITLNLTYIRFSDNPGYNGGHLNRNLVITLNPQSNELITDEASCSSFVQCGIGEIKYSFIEPNKITSEIIEVTESRINCKICPNGKPCKDDGEACSLDIECGSSICNIAGFCGHEKNVSCEPYGKLNCNDEICLAPSTKEVGEAYMCEWECKSQLTKNNSCCDISGSKVNEPYFCETECKYGIEKNNVCKGKPMPWWAYVMIIILTLLIVGLILWLLVIKKWIEIEQKKKEKESLEKELQALQNKIKESQEEIKKLESEKDNQKKEIVLLQKKLRDSRGEAKQRYEEELKKLKKKYQGIENELNSWRNKQIKIEGELREKDRRLQIKQDEIKTKGKEIEDGSYENYIKRQLEKYKKRYNGRSSEVYYDSSSGNLKIKFQNGKEYFLHRHIYYQKYGLKDNEEIHHIDNDPLNDELWNLISIPKEDHNKEYLKFKHHKIIRGDWNSGIQQLREQLGYGTHEKPFPEHIQKEIENQKH